MGAYAEAIWSHLALWRSLLLIAAGDTELARHLSASGTSAAQILSGAQIEQQRIASSHDIQMLVRSLLSLLSPENTMPRATFSVFPEAVQTVLAGRSEQEFVTFGELSEMNDPSEEALEFN